MSSHEETSSTSGDRAIATDKESESVASEEESAVVAEVNQPDLQAEGIPSPPLLSPSSPQSSCSRSTSEQAPGETLVQVPLLTFRHALGSFGLASGQPLGPAPGQEYMEPVHENVGLAYKMYQKMFQSGDYNYALRRQIDKYVSNCKSAKEAQGNGASEGVLPFEPVTVRMMREQAERRMAGTWHVEDVEEEREEEMATSQNEETAGENQVGENIVSTNQSGLHNHSPSNANEEDDQGN